MPTPAHTVWLLFAVVKFIVAFEFTTTLIVAVFAHKPAVGVNVYTVVPALAVLTVDGFHVPVTPFVDVVGNAPAVAPTQYAPNCVNVGVVAEFTTTLIVVVFAHNPAVGVNV